LIYRTMSSPMHRAYNRVRSEVGLPRDPRPYGRALFSDWLVLATGCPSLDMPRPDLPEVVHFVGRISPAGTAYPEPDGEKLRTESSRPLVLITQGTVDVDSDELLQPALLGLADLDVDVLATGGQRGRTDVGIAPPANARVVDLVDFASVLPKTAVMVTNGGWGGVLASLAAGVPLVVAPGGAADKPEIAARVAQFGVGVNLRKRRVKPEAVASAVSEVLGSSAYRERAAQISAELERLGGVGAAADLLEQLSETRAPVRRIGSPWPDSAAVV
jgi:UDP:flavonoid glycosyltransferase YjiC (YdhE family)